MIKKKVKELSLAEMVSICRITEQCEVCPLQELFNFESIYCAISCISLDMEILDEEVDLNPIEKLEEG